MVSSTPRPLFTPGKDPVPILQEAGWSPEAVWTGGISRPHWDSIPDRPALSQSLYRLSYRIFKCIVYISVCVYTDMYKYIYLYIEYINMYLYISVYIIYMYKIYKYIFMHISIYNIK